MLNINDYRCIILDQDGTIYPRESKLFLALRNRTRDWLKEKLNVTNEETEQIYKVLPKQYPNPFLGFVSLGATVREYHEEVFNKISPNKYIKKDKSLVELFETLKPQIFVVTMASPEYSYKLQTHLEIDEFITHTYYVKDYPPDYSKQRCYTSIIKNLETTNELVCVIGDNFETDILPALEIDCSAIHISRIRERGDHETITSIYDLYHYL